MPAAARAVQLDPRTNAEPRLSYVVARVERALRRQLEGCTRLHGLTIPQYTALTVLRARSGLSNAQLARRCYVTPQSMSDVILALEREGLIRRAPDDVNRRVLRTVLTPKGESVLAACDEAVDEMEKNALSAFSATARRRLTADLIQCVHNLGAGL